MFDVKVRLVVVILSWSLFACSSPEEAVIITDDDDVTTPIAPRKALASAKPCSPRSIASRPLSSRPIAAAAVLWTSTPARESKSNPRTRTTSSSKHPRWTTPSSNHKLSQAPCSPRSSTSPAHRSPQTHFELPRNRALSHSNRPPRHPNSPSGYFF